MQQMTGWDADILSPFITKSLVCRTGYRWEYKQDGSICTVIQRLLAPFVLEGIPLPSSQGAAVPVPLGSALFCCLGGLVLLLMVQGREQSSPDLCSHHPPCWVFYAERGNDFNVPVNKLSGRISLNGQTSEMASSPRRCLGKENQFQLCTHTHTTHTTRAPPVPVIFQPFNKLSFKSLVFKRGRW